MLKQTQNYLLKVWFTGMVASPVLFALLMMNSISSKRNPVAEAFLVIAITIGLGLCYFLPSLLLTLLINRSVIKPDSKPLTIKMISALCLLILMGMQLLFLYKNNLSLIYKGTGPMVISYAMVLVVALLYYSRPVQPSVPEPF